MTLALKLLCMCLSADMFLANEQESVVFVVDPSWDSVEYIVEHVPKFKEYNIVKVVSHPNVYPCMNKPGNLDIAQCLNYDSQARNKTLATEALCADLQALDHPVKAIIPTFDTVTFLTDQLAACVGTRANSLEGPLAHARFDKYAMEEAVRNAGLRSVKEKLVTSWADGKAYLESWQPPLSPARPAMLKLRKSSDSLGDFKVSSFSEAEERFKENLNTQNVFGFYNPSIIIQEVLQGKEYVVDSVSRDGVHKVAAVWQEDLRPGNGYFDLYYGFLLMNPEEKKISAIMDYANDVLTATGVQNGASNMELFWVEGEEAPCVVDLNARWCGLTWDGGFGLVDQVIGYNQIEQTANAFLDGDAFQRMPAVPSVRASAALVFILPRQTGTIDSIPGLDIAKKLRSFSSVEFRSIAIGSVICWVSNNPPGIHINLIHSNQTVLDEDYKYIVDLELTNKFYGISRLKDKQCADEELSVLHDGALVSQHRPVPVVAALALAASVAALAFIATRRSARDDADYMTIA